MPFRQFYRDRGSNHPVAYSILTLALGMLACMAISVIISVSLFRQSLQRERDALESNRRATCAVINAQAEAFRASEPVTDAGKRAAEAWENLAVRFNCTKG